jgi:hypothetical protein
VTLTFIGEATLLLIAGSILGQGIILKGLKSHKATLADEKPI